MSEHSDTVDRIALWHFRHGVVREALHLLDDADNLLHGIFGIPSANPEKARRYRQAEKWTRRAHVLLTEHFASSSTSPGAPDE